MKVTLVAPAALVLLLGAAPAVAEPDQPSPAGSASAPPLIDHTEWAYWAGQSSLRVYPTPSGRAAARTSGATGAVPAVAEQAWSEVLARSFNADTPGMRAQFVCHWQYAEIAQPGKTSWNLEPWRPVVDDAEMLASGCNPGASEEPF